MFPVTIGLGGSMSVALNALVSVPATGSGGALLRLRPTDSLDAVTEPPNLQEINCEKLPPKQLP